VGSFYFLELHRSVNKPLSKNALEEGKGIPWTGGHYLRDPNIRVDKWTGDADVNGVQKGYISVRDPATGKWYKKHAETTFFPEHWSKRQTEMEIKSAFGNSTPKVDEPEKWIGTSSSGMKMQGFYKKPNGTGATAWPIYQGKNK
jgi:filamentous hemagglutinin